MPIEKHQYVADITISSLCIDDFSKITLQNVGKRLYIVIDGKLYADPVIENEITNGSVQFVLGDKEDNAQHLSYLLAFEYLPCEFEVIAEYGSVPLCPGNGGDAVQAKRLQSAIGDSF